MCVIARKQTAGRGRHGRNWVSEKDSGLYFSIVLFPEIKREFFPVITLMTAIVVFEILNKYQGLRFKLDIKWSNDVLADEKKICGILAETSITSRGLAVIVGIGINLTSANFPPELKETATSIEQEIGEKIDLDELLKSLTDNLKTYYEILKEPQGHKQILYEWSKRSSYYQKKIVRVNLENETIEGITCGLEDNGALRVEMKNGDIKIIQAGDVERLRKT